MGEKLRLKGTGGEIERCQLTLRSKGRLLRRSRPHAGDGEDGKHQKSRGAKGELFHRGSASAASSAGFEVTHSVFLGRGDHLKRRPLGSETEQAPAGGRCPEEGGLALRQVEGLGQAGSD